MTDRKPQLCIVLDTHDNPYGPFDDIVAAGQWAEQKWPGLEQREDADGKGWDVVLLHDPNE